MVRAAPVIILLLIVAFSVIGVHIQSLFPAVPRVHGANRSISLTGCAVSGGTCRFAGWNGTTATANPTITVQQGDVVSISLSSADFIIHQFLLDADRDGPSAANCPTVDPCSVIFSSPTPITYTFTVNLTPGTYTYFCTIHPQAMLGSFVVSFTVGGTILPVDKLSLVIPYVQVSIVILGIIATTLIVHLRRSSQKTG